MAPLKQGTKEWARQQERARAAHRLTTLTGVKLEDEKMLQQLEEMKRAVGPCLTQAGARLATDERRKNFLGDEDYCDIVDEDKSLPTWEEVRGLVPRRV